MREENVNPMQGRRHHSIPRQDSMPPEGKRRRAKSLQGIQGEEGHGGRKGRDEGLTTTNNAMKQALTGSRDGAGRRRSPRGDVMGGGRSSSSEGGEERRKPHALPPLTQKPRSPIIATSPLENELTSRFIGSPPPSGLRRDESGGGLSVCGLVEEESSGEEERTVYSPSDLEASHPRITLNTAPRRGSPPPPHAIVTAESITAPAYTANSITLRCLASAASETLALRQALTPPPKLVSYRAQGGADAVQEWVPDEDGVTLASPPRKCSSPSIRDLPSPLFGRSALDRPPPPLQSARRSRSTVKLTPINKSS